MAHEKDLELNCRIAPDVNPFLLGDPTRLRQVLINLLGNAIKFTDHGEIVIEVVNSDDPELLQFCVRDTGIGIPKEKQQSVFDSFSQVDASTTRKFGGTGLGLAICKRLVELMDGRIWIASEEGKGTRFYFTVRLPDTDQTPQLSMALQKNGAPVLKPENFDQRPLRVLLAEDVQNNWKLIELYLKAFPIIIDVAQNGVIAVEKFQKQYYDLVLMDSEMPEMDGLSATRAIRKWENENNCSETPIIALTAHAFQEHQQQCFDAGCNGYLIKPIKKNVLVETIYRLAASISPINDQNETGARQKHLDNEEYLDDSCIVHVDAGIEELIPGFMEQTMDDLDAMQKALADSDAETLRRIGHSLKGSAHMYGFTYLGDLGSRIEAEAILENFKSIGDILKKLELYLDRIQIKYVQDNS